MDLIQEANDSLIRSLKHYDPSYNIPIFSYAARYVKGYTIRYFCYKNNTVKVPVLKGKTLKFGYRSLQETVGHNGDNRQNYTRQDFLTYDEDYANTINSKMNFENLMEKINSTKLPQRSKSILIEHFVNDKNFSEIGKELKLTRERIRQIVDVAKKSLTKQLGYMEHEHVT